MMLKKLIGCIFLLIAGCVTSKVIPEYIFPDPPAAIMVTPQTLKQIQKPTPEQVETK